MNINEFFKTVPKAALGFSGGVDSSYLLYAGLQAGAQIRPYFIKTPFQPDFELQDARRLCAQLGIELTVIELDVLDDEAVAVNPADRCYHCKHALFGALAARAAADGYTILIDGTNASDDSADRPGMRALRELQVLSPLRTCGITKRQVRQKSREAGLFTWDKPAYACLATRVPAGQRLTAPLLANVEQAESDLFNMGFSDFRVRVLGTAARLQLPIAQWERALACHEEIKQKLQPTFSAVLLDLEPRGAQEEIE